MTHPSIQGLREAVESARSAELAKTGLPNRIETAGFEAQAAYLTEHGVLLSGERLVREIKMFNRPSACPSPTCKCQSWLVVRLVPVPQDGET